MPSQHSEIKAGAFVAGCIALLFVMVFAVGDCGRIFRGSQSQKVLFSHVTGLQPNSAVNYAGVEIGRVSEVRIVTVNRALLADMPRLGARDLDRLPLTFGEADRLKALKDPARLDAEARKLITDRKMIELSLEIKRSRDQLSFREDDLVRLETTLMGRDIRRLLEKVSGIIGEEERVAIKATLANVKIASEKIALASEDVRKTVQDARKPIQEAIVDFRAGMGEARTTSGRKAAESADKLLIEARPRVLKLMEDAAAAARAATASLKEVESLMVETGDALDENRPAVRRALGDLRESARNFKEMSARLKRQPWLLLKKPRGSQDAILLAASARSLGEASQDLALTMEYLQKIADDHQAAARLKAVKAQDLLDEIKKLRKELDTRRKKLDVKVKELDRKSGGHLHQRARDKADQEK